VIEKAGFVHHATEVLTLSTLTLFAACFTLLDGPWGGRRGKKEASCGAGTDTRHDRRQVRL